MLKKHVFRASSFAMDARSALWHTPLRVAPLTVASLLPPARLAPPAGANDSKNDPFFSLSFFLFPPLFFFSLSFFSFPSLFFFPLLFFSFPSLFFLFPLLFFFSLFCFSFPSSVFLFLGLGNRMLGLGNRML